LGLDITDEAIEQMKAHIEMTEQDFKVAEEEEKMYVDCVEENIWIHVLTLLVLVDDMMLWHMSMLSDKWLLLQLV
jgi:hypothetical protein